MISADRLEARGNAKIKGSPFVLIGGYVLPKGINATLDLINVALPTKEQAAIDLAAIGLILLGSLGMYLSGRHDIRRAQRMRQNPTLLN